MTNVTKVFVSSTFEDLKQHRAHVIDQLRKMGLFVDPMEDWTSSKDEPKEFCRQRLDGCQLCILLVAFRRGFVPEGETRSITQLEYDAARERGLAVLPFLLKDDVPWLPKFLDHDPGIQLWREHLQKKHGTQWFTDQPTSLNISPAVTRWLMERAGQGKETGPQARPAAPPRSPVIGTNFHDPVLFKNREHELAQVWQLLSAAPGKKLIAVVGRGGTGKTALVARLCQKIERGELRHPSVPGPLGVNGLVYFDCRGAGQQTVERLYHALTQLLAPDTTTEMMRLWGDTHIQDAAKFSALFSRLQQGLFLLALDNVEETLNAAHTVADEGLRTFFEVLLTQAHGLRVLGTSSSRILFGPDAVASTQTVLLDKGLPVEDGVALLRELDAAGELGLCDTDERILRQAVQKCYGLPRALYSIFTILETDPTLSLQELMNNQALFNEQFLHNLVAEQYRRLPNERARILEVLAVYGKPVGAEAVKHVIRQFFPRIDVEGCLKDLALKYFVTGSRQQRTYELQPLLQQYAYGQIPDAGEAYFKAACHRAAASYYAGLRRPSETWKSLDDIKPVLEEFDQRVAARDYDTAARLLDQIDDEYLQQWGHYRTVIAMREQLLRQLTSPELLQSNYGNLGLVYRRTGRMPQAATHFQQAIAAAQEAQLPLAVVAWHCELGNTFADLVDMPHAIEQYQRAIVIARASGQTAAEARPQGNLAIAYRQLGRPHDALERYRQAIAIDEQALVAAKDAQEKKRYQRMRAHHTGNSGRVYWALGDYEKALRCYQSAADFMREDNYLHAQAVFAGHIGEVYLAQDCYEEALRYTQQCIDLLRETGETRSMSYALEWQGVAHHRLGHLEAAAQAYTACRQIDAPETNYSSEVLLGILELERTDKAHAQQHLQAGIRLCHELLAKSPHFYEALYRLGLAQLASAQSGESLASYRQALAACASRGVVRFFLLELELLRRTPIPAADIDLVKDLLTTSPETCP